MSRADFIERWLGIQLSPWARRMLDGEERPPAGYLVVNRQLTPEEMEMLQRGCSGHRPRLMIIDDVGDRSMPIAEDRRDG